MITKGLGKGGGFIGQGILGGSSYSETVEESGVVASINSFSSSDWFPLIPFIPFNILRDAKRIASFSSSGGISFGGESKVIFERILSELLIIKASGRTYTEFHSNRSSDVKRKQEKEILELLLYLD